MKRIIAFLCIFSMLFASIASADEASEYQSDNKIAGTLYGTPVIDADEDSQWDKASWVPLTNWKRVSVLQLTLDGFSKTNFKTLWDEKNLYVLVKVETAGINLDNESSWQTDSIDVFLDQDNSRLASEEDNLKFRIDADGNKFMDGVQCVTTEQIKSASKRDDKNYMLEFAIPWTAVTPLSGSSVGFEIQTNETAGKSSRNYIASWNDKLEDKATNRPWRWGTLVLCSTAEEVQAAEAMAGPKETGNTQTISKETVYYYNGSVMPFSNKPVVTDGVTYVPAETLFKKFGAQYAYTKDGKSIIAILDDNCISFAENSTVYYMNWEKRTLGSPTFIQDGMLYIPLRIAAEALECAVEWNSEKARVEILSKNRAALSGESWLEGDFRTVYPEQTEEFINNPYKGWVVYGTLSVPKLETLPEEIWKNISMVYYRTEWKDLEPEEGKYDFSVIDNVLRFCGEHNLKFAFGVSTANINDTKKRSEGSINGQSTPMWLFDKGCGYSVEGGGDIYVPDWNDPLYYAGYKKLMEKIAERYDGDDRLFFIENRFYGNWGEWHLGKLTGSEVVTHENAVKFIDAFDCFEETQIAIVGAPPYEDIIDYCINEKNYMAKMDGFINPNHTSVFTRGESYKGRTALAGEWYANEWKYLKQIENGVWDDTLIDYTVRTAGVTTLHTSGYFSETEPFMTERKYLVERIGNLLGYWFRPTKISYSENFGNGEAGKIAIRLKNDGVAPYYGTRKRQGFMKAALMDADNNILEVQTLDNVNICDIQPGKYSTIISDFKFKKNKDASKLALGIFSKEKYENPDIRFGIADETVNNWYIINEMSDSYDNNMAFGRLYDQSTMGRSENFGYFEGKLAFDNNPETAWKTQQTITEQSPAWVSVDFGEDVTISKMSVKGANIKAWSIQAMDNGQWRDIMSGTETDGKEISFNMTTTRNIRFVVSECDGQAEVYDFVIN